MVKGEIEVGKVYRNIKNQKSYIVEGIGKYTEEPMALETMVFYKALYKDNQPYWIRPYWLFKEKFEVCLACNGLGYFEYETGVEHGGVVEIAKEPCGCVLDNQ